MAKCPSCSHEIVKIVDKNTGSPIWRHRKRIKCQCSCNGVISQFYLEPTQ